METELWTRLNLVYIAYNLYFMCVFYLQKYGKVYIKLGSSIPIKEHPLPVENHNQNGFTLLKRGICMEVMIHFQNFTKSTPYNIALKTHKVHQTFPIEKRMERN